MLLPLLLLMPAFGGPRCPAQESLPESLAQSSCEQKSEKGGLCNSLQNKASPAAGETLLVAAEDACRRENIPYTA
jgi:hypothetical protein